MCLTACDWVMSTAARNWLIRLPVINSINANRRIRPELGRDALTIYLESIMEKLHLKDGYSIYFADVYFDDVIYSMGTGLGFTDVIYGYSLGRDQQEAEQLVTEKYNGKVSQSPTVTRCG